MTQRQQRIFEKLTLAALAVLNLCTTIWAGPPPPPLIPSSGIPSTPVGGMEISIATAVAIAGYGYWKARK